MVPVFDREPIPGFITALRFRSIQPATLLAELRTAVDLLSSFDGFVDARLARAVDDPELIALTLNWTTVGAYRRALSSYDVKVSVVPLLSRAMDEPTAFEVLQVSDSEGSVTASGTLAADAGTVSLGEAAAERVTPEPS
jgi:hypothetical protein